MFRIILVELKKYLTSPILIMYLIFPLFPFIMITLTLDMPTALTFVIFLQTLFISLFVYGSRLKNYRSETITKKINNSKIKHSNPTIALLLISLMILFFSLLLPFIITMFSVYSISSFSKHQFSISINDQNPGHIKEALGMGLDKNLLLFNSNILQFLQFIFALTIVVGSIFSFAHLTSISIKSDSVYFSFSLLMFLFIMLLSSLTTKDMFILYDGEYTRNVPNLGNNTFLIFKYLNPFYWINQLLMNSIIANSNSGYVANIEDFPIPPGIDADGTFIPSYFNIFHIGTSIGEHPYFKTIFLNNIEIFQISTLIIPFFCFVTPIVYTLIKGVN